MECEGEIEEAIQSYFYQIKRTRFYYPLPFMFAKNQLKQVLVENFPHLRKWFSCFHYTQKVDDNIKQGYQCFYDHQEAKGDATVQH